MSQEYQNSENYVPTNELFLEIYVQEHWYHTLPTGIMGPFSEARIEGTVMHAHEVPRPFVIRQQHQQLYWYSYLELQFQTTPWTSIKNW